MTNLEAIALKLEEEKKARLESVLSVSGSSAIAKNQYGVTIVDDKNVASSLLFKSLTKTKLDDTELLKAIDVEVKELKPDIPTINKDLVPKPLYDEKVVENDDLRKEVKKLTDDVQTLTNEVTDLKSQLQTEINNKLNIEQTNDVVINQLDTLSGTLGDMSGQISTSLQKSIDESILRASLQSQNTGFKAQINALIKQIDSLNSIIRGLQSQLGAVQQQQAIQQGTQAQAMASGADVINEVVIAKITQKSEPTRLPIFGKISGAGGNKWVNGKSIDFTNNDKQSVSISIAITATKGMQWFSVSESSFELAAGAQKTINMNINESAASGVDSKSGKLGAHSKSANYKGGSLKISVKRTDGSVKDKSYEVELDKNHPDSY